MNGNCQSVCLQIRPPTQRPDQTRLRGRQQLREHSEIRAAGGANLQRCVHVEADHVPARCEPKLALAREKHLSGLVLLLIV